MNALTLRNGNNDIQKPQTSNKEGNKQTETRWWSSQQKVFNETIEENAEQPRSVEQNCSIKTMKKIVSFEQFDPADFKNDHVGMWAAHLGMSREEYVAHYASPTIGSGIDEEYAMEANDHEVGMAQGQLEAIHKAAAELQEKIGTEEKDLPGWIQDHISQAYSFLQQANDNFHELEEGKNNAISPIIDILSNSMEDMDETEFADILSDFGYGFEVASDVFNAYWDLGAKDRMHYNDKDWTSWLKKHGIDESFDHLDEINLNSVGMKEFIKKLSNNKEAIEKLGFNKLKDIIAYLKDGSLQDWEELRDEGAAIGITVESEQIDEGKLKMLMDPLMLKIMKQFGFDRDPQIKAELREEIKAAVEAVLKKHDIIVE